MISVYLKAAGYYYRSFPTATRTLQMSRRFFSSRANDQLGACAEVFVIPMWNDNYCYVIVDRETRKAALIDPAEPEAVMNGLQSIECEVDSLLCTHKHQDHAGGNTAFAEAYPGLKIYGSRHEPIPAVTHEVTEGDTFTMGSLNVRVLYVPCHTSGHIAFYITPSGHRDEDAGEPGKAPLLCCGDTLFVGGCGRFFEGTPDQMLSNMDKFATLPPSTLVCCAHEYTAPNFRFLVSVDASRCQPKYHEIQELRAADEPTVPSTIGEELKYNLFMNCRDQSVQLAVLGPDATFGTEEAAVETMGRLREMKNAFK